MNRAVPFLAGVLVLASGSALFGQAPQPGKNSVTVRGQQQDVYYYAGKHTPSLGKILFAPGDGGWHGLAVAIAENLASSGYDVYGLDTRRYLQSFTGTKVLQTSEIAADFRQLAEWVRQGSGGPILLLGWSEGAGLGLAAAADAQHSNVFQGLVAVGMTEYNILALRWSDLMAEIKKKLPNEPTFKSADFIDKISPLPLAMISSTHDEYVSVEAARKLFAAAREPKHLVLIDAENHKFGGKTDEFFRELNENLQWIQQQKR
jgi:alpha-beta hydrolase superfamily lysophospholipase